MISTSEINILNQTGFHLSLKTKAYLKHQEIEKIFTQLSVHFFNIHNQLITLESHQNTIEITTQPEK
jgi:hypothetical protein